MIPQATNTSPAEIAFQDIVVKKERQNYFALYQLPKNVDDDSDYMKLFCLIGNVWVA